MRTLTRKSASLLAMVALLSPVAGHTAPSDEKPLYLDPAQPVEARIKDLMPRLTLEEKIIQIKDNWGVQGIPRLKVPPFFKCEASHGYAYATGATIFPVAVGIASTWDTDLVYRIARVIGEESKAANSYAAWTPVLDLARDPRWGRVEETYGEDPCLVSRMGVAWVKGYQSLGLVACPKHFAAHGGPLGGRDSCDVGYSERVMRESYLVPFRAAVREGGALGMMSAYSTWVDGIPCSASPELLVKILREEWGFSGYVVTDVGAGQHFVEKHAIAADYPQACKVMLDAGGVEVEASGLYEKGLKSAIKAGIVAESDLDRPLAKMLEMKFRLGLFEKQPDKMIWEKVANWDIPAHRAVAAETSRKSIVLLKNQDGLLPLKKDLKAIAVIGCNAAEGRLGGYSAKPLPGQVISVLEGIRRSVGAGTQVLYAKGCDETESKPAEVAEAVEAAKKADVVVAVLGDTGKYTGENHDRAQLDLPAAQEDLLKALHATGKPVVLVLVNGRPFTINWEAENLPAILVTWFPGEEGGAAAADVLFGVCNPGGKLPVTFPRSSAQAPFYYNFKPSGRGYKYSDMPFEPLYPFGFGLSYTTFEYGTNLQVQVDQDQGLVRVKADVKNTGKRKGDEIVQLYITDLIASVSTPVTELKGFRRVTLEPGQTATVEFELTPYQLSLLDARMRRVVEPGVFKVMVGGVSPWIKPHNEMKQRMGYDSNLKGVNGQFELTRRFAADFQYDFQSPASVKAAEAFDAVVTVRNAGTLTDVGEAELFADGRVSASRRFELDPGETRRIVMPCRLYRSGESLLSVRVGDRLEPRTVRVKAVPAALQYEKVNLRMITPEVLTAQVRVRNVGSKPYTRPVELFVDDHVVASTNLDLDPGLQQDLVLTHRFDECGVYRARLDELPVQAVDVPGSVALPSRSVALWMDLDAVKDGRAQDLSAEANHGTVKGASAAIEGKTGKALQLEPNAVVTLGTPLDLQNKSYTLAAWVRVDRFNAAGNCGLFGGTAPDGAGQDGTGYVLNAGLRGRNPAVDVCRSGIEMKRAVEQGKWFHFAYSYDAGEGVGSLYLNGRRDLSKSQKPYLGQLMTVGGSSSWGRGGMALGGVRVLRMAADGKTVQRLMTETAENARRGVCLTDWRATSGMIGTMAATADVPAGTKLEIAIEIGDEAGKVLTTKVVTLKDGQQTYEIDGLKAGQLVRCRIQFDADRIGLSPVLRTLRLNTKDGAPIRWSTQPQWDMATWGR